MPPVPETLAGEQSCKPRQHRPICRLQCWSVDLGSKDCYLVAQDQDLDRKVRLSAATDETDQLEDAAGRPVEELDSHGSGCSPRPAPVVKVQVAADG